MKIVKSMLLGLGLVITASCMDMYNDLLQESGLESELYVKTIAGAYPTAESGYQDGTGTLARFNAPYDITIVGGNLYVADRYNNAIRKIEISSGNVTTYFTIISPVGITTDGSNLYVTTVNHVIYKMVLSNSIISVLAGLSENSGSADGPAALARFNFPRGMVVVGSNLYVADMNNHTIRKIDLTGLTVSTFCGLATFTGTTDGTGTNARFSKPIGITSDGTNLYVADNANHIIRKIVIATADVSTIAGSGTQGFVDAKGRLAEFDYPVGIFYHDSFLFVTDQNNYAVRQIRLSDMQVTTIAGGNGSGLLDGEVSSAQFTQMKGLVMDDKNLYIVDFMSDAIRKLYKEFK
ncbi:MAG: hypothetical protein JW982_00020 [Spirochaetes bacterium]|nr:hypothetical protein [Spirochaetota bacterium]